jgi:D-glycero-alpha-D-manno-heptose-7-phosphate kinase
MIISRTPFRVSFFGGGTDYPAWFKEHDGAVLATTIDKYCYISVRVLPPFFAHRYRLVCSIVENVKEITEIQHPAVRAVLQWNGSSKGSKSITTVICRRAPGWAPARRSPLA